jgi:hypothetical protein
MVGQTLSRRFNQDGYMVLLLLSKHWILKYKKWYDRLDSSSYVYIFRRPKDFYEHSPR